MRQIAPGTNLVLAVLSTLGLLATLGLPWYAPAAEDAADHDGAVEHAAARVAAVFDDGGGTITGLDALGHVQALLVGLAGAIVVLCALAAVRAVRPYVRDVLRLVALAEAALVASLVVHRPAAGPEIHWGVLVALAAAVFTASAAWHGSAIRARRRPAAAPQRRRAV